MGVQGKLALRIHRISSTKRITSMTGRSTKPKRMTTKKIGRSEELLFIAPSMSIAQLIRMILEPTHITNYTLLIQEY